MSYKINQLTRANRVEMSKTQLIMRSQMLTKSLRIAKDPTNKAKIFRMLNNLIRKWLIKMLSKNKKLMKRKVKTLIWMMMMTHNLVRKSKKKPTLIKTFKWK